MEQITDKGLKEFINGELTRIKTERKEFTKKNNWFGKSYLSCLVLKIVQIIMRKRADLNYYIDTMFC